MYRGFPTQPRLMTPFRGNDQPGPLSIPATFFQEEFRLILSEAQNGLSFDPERDGVFAQSDRCFVSLMGGFTHALATILWQMRMVWSFPDFGFPEGSIFRQSKPSTDGPGHPSLILPLGMIPVVVTRVQGDESLVFSASISYVFWALETKKCHCFNH